MIEIVLLFFTAIVWYEIIGLGIISVLMVGLLWEEHASVPFGGLLVLLFYDWETTGAFIEVGSILDAWVYLLVYIAIGLMWSFFKWGRLINRYIVLYDNEEDVRFSLSAFSNDNIAYWVMWWPFSILGFVFDDAIQWIIEHFRGVYNLITDKLINSAISAKDIKQSKDDSEDFSVKNKRKR